jgi:hypothetical protein
MFHSRDCAQVQMPNVSSDFKEYEKRTQRDIQEDLKSAIDLMFDFKKHLNKFHPGASEAVLRMFRDGF